MIDWILTLHAPGGNLLAQSMGLIESFLSVESHPWELPLSVHLSALVDLVLKSILLHILSKAVILTESDGLLWGDTAFNLG
jgi:hypothetical protein